MEQNRELFKTKIIFTFCIFLLLFFAVLSKAFYLQVINRGKLLAYSKGQIVRISKVYPNRGNIFDRTGSPLALNVKTYSIFTIPKLIKEKEKTYRALAAAISELKYPEIMKKIQRRENYTWLARKITLTETQIKKLEELKGIYFEPVPKRVYPNNELAAQILGFVGVDNKGLAGIEYQFDELLRGEPKVIRYHKDAKGRPIKYVGQEAGVLGKDIHLSIDKTLQGVAEKYLKEAVLEFSALRGGIGVINYKNGEILAMANYPSFDPNHPMLASKQNPAAQKLSFISDPLEPGSTFKIFTAASALEHKMARPDTNYYCEKGLLQVDNHYITEAENKKSFEWMSMVDIIKYSSNIGTTKIAFDLTFPRLRKTLLDFRIGQKTGIELPGESRGIFVDTDKIPLLSLSNISFGQGVATTGLQMLAGYAAIANKGIYLPPTILRDGNKNAPGVRVISEEVAQQLLEMLQSAVKDGTGTNALIPYFTIAGKTSTAQRPAADGGYQGHNPAFVGLPISGQHTFLIYVYIERPEGKSYYGNLVAAPVFKQVAQYLLYRDKNITKIEVGQNGQNKSIIDSVQVKNAATRIVSKNTVPDFVGLDKKSARQLAEQFSLALEHQGMGVVSAQVPAAGTPIESNLTVELKYAPPNFE